jgi:RNA polymerase sigma-70 factor (ECF subfamily)
VARLTRWDSTFIAEGHALVRSCLRRNRPGPYQLQAAINAVHDDAATAADTDWRQIVALYDQLMIVEPTPVVALNRCIAVAEVHGPVAALELLAGIDLDGYRQYHATRAEMLRAGLAGPPRRPPPTMPRSCEQRTAPSGRSSSSGAILFRDLAGS